MAPTPSKPVEPIAIIGSGCRFPGNSNTPSQLWELLKDPKDLLTPVPNDRFNTAGYYHQDGTYHGHSNARHAHFLAGDSTHRQFDARFFGVSAAEANVLDPQIRLLLETVYEALEAAGQTIEGLQGTNTAMYAGTMLAEYERMMLRDEDSIGTYHAIGTARAMVSNRVSYFFDWHGPSMTIDTACSSSLIAVSQAVQQLRTGHSRVAVAAGANLILDPQSFISFSKLGMLSPEGRSRMWDANVTGYARGEGIAAIVLKTLSAAEADGDHIECVIREAGANQDGKTPGLTMPSATAQARLIRECYERAGLDLTKSCDRPQFFEAHGTGTKVGDPIEAEAIHTAFFPKSENPPQDLGQLFVGGIKSIIGHTEGTAGLAALLKGSLAVQNSMIPPNLLFNRLNPKIEPFSANLQVPTTPLPWPGELDVRRVSVNSFGFGGSNAHAILENYIPSRSSSAKDDDIQSFSPYVFSAASKASLDSYLTSFCDYLRVQYKTINARNLAYTLHSRRSRLQINTAVAASSLPELCEKLEEKLKLARSSKDQEIGVRSLTQGLKSRKPQVLGIFTGQGAQWARMGAELVEKSACARNIINKLDLRLSQLPPEDRPSWSLLGELLTDTASSRVSQAAFSQPLCTAIQILQVDLLQAADLEFSAVVGHSSGEIGASYAAGFISAEDAICIAYYRGLYSDLAQGRKGESGAMMAVSSTITDIQELCGSRKFRGLVGIAAINSPSSFTVSGDQDAVEGLGTILQDENKFARLLKVDKAYHSHHMLACSETYLKALAALKIQVRPGDKCSWFSSVEEGEVGPSLHADLQRQYWNNNLIRPVLFMQAVQSAWTSKGPFDLAIEVGPHPALKSPALETINGLSSAEPPYTGLLQRGRNSVESVADSLGFAWSYLGNDAVNLQAYDTFLAGSTASNSELVKGLPPYSWDHENEYWHESRYTRVERTRSDPVHELLGHITPDSTEQEMRWRNILRPKEIPWVKGHQLQGQTVYPAAAYVVMALEAAMQICRSASVSLIDVQDLELGKALTFDHDDMSVETIFSITKIVRSNAKTVSADFTYQAAGKKETDSLDLLASGRLRVTLGEFDANALPKRTPRLPSLLKVQSQEFYESLRKLEYQYTHPFDALVELERKLGYSTGKISNLEPTNLLIHPAMLDAAFQTTFLARSVPFDGGIWALHVPQKIRNVRVNPVMCAKETAERAALPFDAVQPWESSELVGDVDIFPSSEDHAMIQVEGLVCVPFAARSAKDDKEVFSMTTWDVAHPDVNKVAFDFTGTPDQRDFAHLLERVSVFYLRNLNRFVPSNHHSRSKGPLKNLYRFAAHYVAEAESGKWPFWRREWNHDTYNQIARACGPFADAIDIRLLRAIGENFVDIGTGEKGAIEVGMKDNLLSDYYQHSLGTDDYTRFLARTVKQIVHRHAHMNILEIGAGTGGATRYIFREIGQMYASYTFTDVSSGFFPKAQDVFDGQHGMIYKVLDANKPSATQGFEDHSYDLIVGSMVIHATDFLETTLRNVRRLLKPGGYFVMLEGLPDTNVRYGTIFGAFAGWWAGNNDGRVLSPLVNVAGWDKLLRKTGFSGVDSASPDLDHLIAPLMIIVSQATDDKIALLRDPLSCAHQTFGSEKPMEELVVVGGTTLRTSRLAGQVKDIVDQYCINVQTLQSLKDLASLQISGRTTILCLNELDDPFFKGPTRDSWEVLRGMLIHARSVLWVTSSRRSLHPHANMMVGLLRSSPREIPTLDVQFLDFADIDRIEPKAIAEALLRFKAGTIWRDTDERLLNTVEPEIVLDEEHREIIPRLVVNQEMNDRYNSSRRPVFSSTKIQSQRITVDHSEAGYVLHQEPATYRDGNLRVSFAQTTSIKITDSGSLFLALGRDCRSGEQEIVLSTQNASIVHPWSDLSILTEIDEDAGAEFLFQVAHQMLALVFLKDLTQGNRVLVLHPSTAFAEVITWRARNMGVHVTFATFEATSTNPTWLKLHPGSTNRELRNQLPKDLSVFIDWTDVIRELVAGDRLHCILPKSCRQETTRTIFRKDCWTPLVSQADEIRCRLQDAVNHAYYSLSETEVTKIDVPVVQANALCRSQNTLSPQAIINWTSSSEASVQVRPIDSQPLFSASKTYWLAGLSHGLGLSLCEWMFRRGGRHFVLSSRRPNIDESWLSSMAVAGASVRVFACDLTDEEEVVRTHAAICANMPQIGGVTQGAMVLDDTSITDMTFDQLIKVTGPKVEGSMHLNNLFETNTLEFFVFFSSASAVVGYAGQANYSAANLFMWALAEQRHQRGLAASVINIGPVLGVGYIAQQDVDLRRRVEAGEGMFLSEQDFHQLFAEAVLAGQPGALGPIQVTTGVVRVGLHREAQPVWASNPIMSHYVRNDDGVELAMDGGKTIIPIKTKLAQARSKDAVLSIMKEAFLTKLGALYQVSTETLAKEDPSNLDLNEMGTDSLLATEIRGWFMKTLQVNIPVLKILGGATVQELLEIATEAIAVDTEFANTPPSDMAKHAADLDATVVGSKTPTHDGSPPISPPQESESDTSGSQYGESSKTTDIRDCNDETQPSSAPSELDLAHDHSEAKREESQAMSFEKMVPLSYGQAMFWFVLSFLEDKSSLNHTASFRLSGTIRHDDFEYALKSLSQQHEIMRACFFDQDGQPMQGILESSTVHGQYRQIKHEQEVSQVVKELETYSFDVARGESLRVVLLTLSPTTHFLVLSSHSLVVDGTSFRVFLKDLQQHYLHVRQNRETPQFLDYALTQHENYESGKFEPELCFWKREFSDFPDPLPIFSLGKIASRPALTTYENERADIRFGPQMKARIKSLCRRAGATPFHFYLTVFRALLTRFADVEDFSVGIADANRSEEEMMDCIGPFVNLLPLRFRTKSNVRFDTVLTETRSKSLAALANSKVPFQILLNELGAPRSANYTPIFQSFVDYRLGQQEKSAWADCQLEMLSFQVSKLAYDVALDIIDDPNGDCLVMLIVRSDLYSQKDAECLVKSYERLVKAFAAHPSNLLDEPELFGDSDIKKAIAFGQGPVKTRVWHETIIHRVDEMMDAHPNVTAVRWDDGNRATYADIQEQMYSISNALLGAGVSGHSRVAVLQGSSGGWISSILAIMRLGAAYIPLDQGNPWNRLAAITQDSQPSVVLVDDETEPFVEKLGSPNIKVLNVSDLQLEKPSKVPIAASSQCVAALLYTSGSTGTPKGIVLRHAGLCNWQEFTGQIYDLGAESVLQQSSSGFDMSLIQIFTALCYGGSMYLVPRRLRGDAQALSELIYSQGITYTFTCTSELLTWFKYGKKDLLSKSPWRRAITGGEPGVDMLFKDFALLQKSELRMFHAYGPTEISWTATTRELFYSDWRESQVNQSIPVGKPLPNYTVYLLDQQLKPVPPGVQGEICVGGPGLAAGYLNRPELTAEKFMETPLAAPEGHGEILTKLHRTGDLGRWGEDGDLFIEGRIQGDTQIKLRGLRIDLREVERAMVEAAKGTLSEAVVSVRRGSQNGPQFLTAHVVFEPSCPEHERTRIVATLQSCLTLPRYMCPSVIIPLEQMPLTNTLKLDRRAIAAMSLPEIENTQHVEFTVTEGQLRSIWEAVISESVTGLHRVEPGTDFFHIGGTSLLLLELRRWIQAKFDVELSLIDMFNNSTLASMALQIEGKGKRKGNETKIDWDEETALTPAFLQAFTGQRHRSAGPKTVVLTGSTGYLGRGILDALVKDPTVIKIHCVAVRNVNTRRDMQLLNKVVLYEGDLGRPRLGLSTREAREIFHSADVIIHNGADVSYLKSFASLRLPNLQSTKELAEMGVSQRIPLHYISSGGACTFAAVNGQRNIGPSSVANYPPFTDGKFGYASSKWASEIFLEKLQARYPDWPVWIHRPSNIARIDTPQLDLVYSLQHYSRVLHAVPKARGKVYGVLDSVTLERVVQGVLRDAVHPEPRTSIPPADGKPRFCHHLGGVDLPMKDLRSWIVDSEDREASTRRRSEIGELPFDVWATKAGEMGMHPALVAFFQAFASSRGMIFPHLVTEDAGREMGSWGGWWKMWGGR